MNLKEFRYKKTLVFLLAVVYQALDWYVHFLYWEELMKIEYADIVNYSLLILPGFLLAMALSDSVRDRIVLIVLWLVTIYVFFWISFILLIAHDLSV